MNKFSNIIKNISYTLSSNLLTLCVSVIVSLLLPKVLGIREYGYYQLYIFYTSYVGLLHFGWCDGIYLRYGGESYSKLNKSKIAGQFYSFLIFQGIITLGLLFLFFLLINDGSEKKVVLLCSISNIIILNLRTFYMLVLQTTNRMKEYSQIVLIDRLAYIIIILFFVFFNVTNVALYIIFDVLSKIISLFFAVFICSDIVFQKKIDFDCQETKLNVFSGINLMLANISSMLIIGIVRFGIQNNWSVEIFGKISLTLSISNMLMIFVSAISLAIFPLVKQTSVANYEKIYPIIRTMIMPIMFLILLLYFPSEILLSKWLPEYKEALKYMVLVFPMIVFESKVSLLTNTFLKALRKEKEIFKINILVAFMSLIATFIFVYLMNNLFLSMLSIVMLLAIRSTLSEIILKKYLEIMIFRDIFNEIIVVILFIYIGWNYSKMIGFGLYFSIVVVYMYLKKTSIVDVIELLKMNDKNDE